MQSDFIGHLAGKGVLRSPQPRDDDNADARCALLPDTLKDDALKEIDWIGLTKLTQSSFADELAEFYQCDRVQRSELLEARFLGASLSQRFLKERKLFPYEGAGGDLMLGIAIPVDQQAVRAIEIALSRPSRIAVATKDDIEAALAKAPGDQRVASDAIEAKPSDDDLDELHDLARGAPVVRAVDDLIRLAVEQRATDLHIEPFGNGLQARLRVDGLLKHIPAPPASMARGILSRLKIMAGLNITERRIPQDGRARISVGGTDIDLRIATMPSMHGESAVVRLLRKGSGFVALDQLGLSKRDDEVLRGALQAPFGMIVVTGPTGSGKTTTLAASLATINEPTRKILTIEDPIEYQIPGINQTQVHPAIGLTFASALRSFLRHDPDVIMVGEMRDAETAHIGVHASLTGHLVLTTLHTNTAAGAVPRLIDMGVESFLLASSLRAIVGQRLVRVLCDHCKEPHALSATEITPQSRSMLDLEVGAVVYRPKGCEWCGGTGFRGRKGVFEIIEVTPAVRDAIGPKTTTTELERIARREGMTTMIEDGVAKCRGGLTTIHEIVRVTASL